MTDDQQTRHGGCLCGAIRYRITGAPLISAVCHCRNCQRQGGSAFSVVCAVTDDNFQHSGEMRIFVDRGESGLPVQRHFCPTCGSPIVSIAEALPGLTIVKAGTLDEPDFVQPTQEAYCRDAWASIPRLPETECFATTNIGTDR